MFQTNATTRKSAAASSFVRPRRLYVLLLLLLPTLLPAWQARAQTGGAAPPNSAAGRPTGSYQLGGFDNVNLFNGNLNFTLPLLQVGGRGGAQAPISLSVDSTRWKLGRDGGVVNDSASLNLNPNNKVDAVVVITDINTFWFHDYDSIEGRTPHFKEIGGSSHEVIIDRFGGGLTDAGGTLPEARYYTLDPDGWQGAEAGYGPGVIQGRIAVRRSGQNNQITSSLTRIVFTGPDGTELELRDLATYGRPFLTGQTNPPRGRVFVSADGTAATFIADAAVTDNPQEMNAAAAGDLEHDLWLFAPDGFLLFADGTRYRIADGLVRWIRDRNGNLVSFSYDAGGRVTSITDSLGRVVTVGYHDRPDPADPTKTVRDYDQISFSGFGGRQRSIIVRHRKLSEAGVLRADFPAGNSYRTRGNLFPQFEQGADASLVFDTDVVTAVELPDGRSYRLLYNHHGEVARVALPTGGAVEYDYHTASSSVTTQRAVWRRRVYEGGGGVTQSRDIGAPTLTQTYTSQRTGSVADLPYRKAVTAEQWQGPDGAGGTLLTRERHHFRGWENSVQAGYYPPAMEGREEKAEALATSGDAATANVLRSVTYDWRQRPVSADSPQEGWNNNVSRDLRMVESVTTLENGLSSKSTSIDPGSATGEVGFDRYNNRTDLWEYDYKAEGEPWKLLRHASTKYLTANPVNGIDYACSPATTCGQWVDANDVAHLNGDPESLIHIRGLPAATEVRDAAGTVFNRSMFRYDEQDRVGDDYGALPADFPGWVAPTTPARGNLTTASSWLNTLGGYQDEEHAYLKTRTQYDRFGNAVKAWDARGNVSEVKFSAGYKYALPTQTTSADPDGPGPLSPLTTTTVYDLASGMVTDAYDANNQQTHLDYESEAGTLDRLKKVTPPPGAGRTEYEYGDTAGDLQFKVKKQVSENVWDEVVTFYDNLGRNTKTQAHDSVGEVFTETLYDPLGRIRQTSSPYRTGETKHWVETNYDGLGRVKEVISPKIADELTPAKIMSEYSTATAGAQIGLVQVGINQAGKRARSITNALGQLVRVDEPNEAGDIGPIDNPTRPTFYFYNTLGNLIRVKQGEQSRFFLYDSLGRLIRVRQPEQDVNPALALNDPLTGNAEWSAGMIYDESGNVRTATDAKGVTITYEYDSLGRLLKRSYAVPQTTDPKKVTLPTSEVTFKYDGLLSPAPGDPTPTPVPFAAGKLTEISNGASTTQYTEFDNLGRAEASRQIVDGQVYPFGYKYNLSGELYEEVYPSGRVVTSAFDDVGDLSSVSSHPANQAPKVYVSDFKYTADGAVEQLKLGNQRWETYKYNARQQVTRIGLGNSPTDTGLWRVDYEYGRFNPDGTVDVTKNDGNLVRQTITVPGAAQPFVQTYGYDPLNRLTEAAETAGGQQTWKQTFGYDRFGNRTEFSQMIGQTPLVLNNVNHPEIDTLTNRFKTGQGYEYDLNGNLIRDAEGRRFGFDGDNKQGVVKDDYNNVVATYSYDGGGKRVKKTVVATGEVTVFVYDAVGKLAAEYSNILPPNPGTRYVTADVLETPRVITDGGGEVLSRRDYMPFGEDLFAGRSTDQKYGYASGVRQGFTGYEKDEETRLSFAEARYYNPPHGRFTAVDPLLASGRSSNPQSYNRYAYAGNNPTLRTDPNGEDWFESTRDVLVGYTRRTEISYQWKRGGREVRSHIVFTSAGPTRGLVVLDKWENRFKEVSSIKEGQAQFEAYRRQAVLNYLAGVAEALSLVVELSGAFDGLGIERGSDMFKVGTKVGRGITAASAVLGGGGLASFLANRLGSRAASYAGRGLKVLNPLCFVAGTPVHTDRGLKAIEEIKVGDKVLSWDERGKRYEYKAVIRTFARQAERLVKVYVAGEDSPIVGTPEHPFYVRVHRARDGLSTAEDGDEAGEWVAAGELGSGDEVLRAGGGWAAVTGVEAEERAEAVYNFEVADNHNYFVGSQGALVHNNCLPFVNKAVNSELVHASKQAIARGFAGDVRQAAEALRDLSKQITQSGLPAGTILDTAHDDRVLVPFQEGLYAVYQVGANGTAKLKTVLIAR